MTDFKTFTIEVKYKLATHDLKCEVVYESAQILRIKVYGKKSSITLQNNFPFVRNGRKAIQWKLIDGSLADADFLSQIIAMLERKLKRGNVL